MSHINLDGFFGDLPGTGDVSRLGALDSGLLWFDEIENILMKDDDIHVLAEPGAEWPCRRDSSFPRTFASPAPRRRLLPASCKMRQRGLSSGSRRPQVKKASPDRPPSIVINGEGEEDATLAESMRSTDWEILAMTRGR
ncbi:uncharacterized protein LOC120286049 [Eucalyptus grandis]|uniref:uncharacterized protein LOC120286049 n=1 Tax=Eucalyptus grandis TaxID=71139 RepID=UPI00192E9B1D|nr:uncharacterized protein LOC120286049 [Eucalyptus grandis]